MSSFDDPAYRARHIETYGIAAYERALAEHHRQQVVCTVNGHDIRAVNSGRFGRIYMVDGMNRGHATLEGAKQIAEGLL